MSTPTRPPRQIDGKGRTIRELLAGRKYDHNPGLRRFIEESGPPFRTHVAFKKADLDARQDLYGLLAERIWSSDRLAQEAAS